jgi:hypothetical protein
MNNTTKYSLKNSLNEFNTTYNIDKTTEVNDINKLADHHTIYMKLKIDNEIKKCNKISDKMKKTQYNFLYVLFWIGIKLEEIGYKEQQIEKLLITIAFKIKLSSNRWDFAYNYIKNMKNMKNKNKNL